ncbi:helix-turn-helix domain-containing protein [Ancylobacter sp. IITR112]|uniref:helix-turn-helix domain-containing protein n=1 Tax=Ancylobacter sp. IITR112 TaxID=3138073 RepID=UPI00352A675D
MIIRRRYNRNFTVLPNAVLDDNRLSAEAMGVLCYLRSRPADWNVELSHLSERFKIGRDKTQRVVAELVSAGWIKRERTRDPVTRAFNGMDYVVYDEPTDTTDGVEDVSSAGEPQPENPVVAHGTPEHHPQPCLPRAAFQAVHIEETNTDSKKRTPIAPKGAVDEGTSSTERGWEADPAYLAFLAEYGPSQAWPRHRGYRQWLKLTEDERKAAVAAIPAYRAICAKERRKMSDPSAYLRGTFKNFPGRPKPRAPESEAVQALRKALGTNFSGGVMVELGSPQWAAWASVAEEAQLPLRAIGYPARPFAGRPKAVTGRYMPSEWPPSRDGPDRQQQAAGG